MSSQHNQAPLPYRALTSDYPTEISSKVQAALDTGYRLSGDLIIQKHKTGVTYIQVVLSQKVSESGPNIRPDGYQVVTGDTSRSFCEEVSSLTGAGWLLSGCLRSFENRGKVYLTQILIKPKPRKT